MIAIREVRKRFGGVAALDGITASISPGEFVLLLGANGAGKTTLLRCLLGLHAFEGTITVAGRDVAVEGAAARALLGSSRSGRPCPATSPASGCWTCSPGCAAAVTVIPAGWPA